MTKRIILFVFILITSLSMNAQSIVGTWKANDGEYGENTDFYISFTESILNIRIVGKCEDSELFSFVIVMDWPCTYTRQGNKLDIIVKREQVTFDIVNFKFAGQLSELENNPDAKSSMKSFMMNELKGAKEDFKEGFFNLLPQNGKLIIVSNTGKKLELRFDEEEKVKTYTKVEDFSLSSQKVSDLSNQTTNSVFVGGETAILYFIASTLRYPALAAENGEQGTVFVGVTVEADGSLTNIHIEKSVSESLDKEAMRVVSKMPKWKPAQSGGVNVKSEQMIKVNFKLQ